MAGMTKRHYELIADALAALPADASRDDVIDKLADTFADDNDQFRRRRFATQARGELDDFPCKQYGVHNRNTRHSNAQCGFPEHKDTN